ncbi:MAG: dihydroneopterin aldolase [bacterium]
MPNDILRLRNMTFHAYHGVWDEEREIGQRFEVDMELKIDVRAAAASDKLKDTVDLYAVFEAVEEVIVNQKVNLVETMAERVAERVLDKFAVAELMVRVRKPHAPIRGIQDGIEVEIIRKAGS